MPEELIIFITNYGYLAIFLLVFSQEIGVPNPIPNEMVLMIAGSLTLKGLLYLPFLILTAILADFIGTNILYIIFYFLGSYIVQKKPSWVPISLQTIEKYKKKISNDKIIYIFIGRLTPFIRGYTSVVTGLLKIKPSIFLPIALISATIWSTLCVIIGRLFGVYLNCFSWNIGKIRLILLTVGLIVLLIVVFIKYVKKGSVIQKGKKYNRFYYKNQ